MVELLLTLDRNNAQDRALMQNWTPEFAYGFMPADSLAFKEDFLGPLNEEGSGP